MLRPQPLRPCLAVGGQGADRGGEGGGWRARGAKQGVACSLLVLQLVVRMVVVQVGQVLARVQPLRPLVVEIL